MIEQCALYVPCSRCRHGRNLGYGEYECRERLAPDGKAIHDKNHICGKGREKEWTDKKKG